ncbi:phage capsid protein [Ewingella americana]|uniref:Phage capsid scaffolding protein (GPO) serine peptidase n=1 Tax=Ewingella americana TaxID=41202 RepID=A0A377N818_9GAMM|nr:GPO family capsid scaffolding protein [Ewingella americana]KAA8727576.1 phage capsid protein [Ewingella americana]STQ42859.1 Phage capsid scaffolding protein (GPO) serine peptidase [Ewingella americana]
MADSQLMTNWICIATEGETVDKRELTRKMLIDAAETYNPELYTALLWPEHERYAGNAGEVLELDYAENEERLVKLYARLCPSTDLINANRNGKLLFSSVELTPDGNFRGTGRYYLQGLGVTDEPASVGTTRMRFNKRKDNYFIGNSSPLVINEIKEMNMAGKTNTKSKWRSLFSIEDEQPQEETPPADDKLQALAEALAALETRVSALETKTDETDEAVDDIQTDVDTVKEVVDTEDFARLRDNLPAIVKNFSKLATTLPKNNPKGTKSKFKFL